jgi:manganese transport protein
VIFTSRRELMGPLVNTRRTTAVAWLIATLIIALNAFLLYETFVAG